jgi:hypothetical protein
MAIGPSDAAAAADVARTAFRQANEPKDNAPSPGLFGMPGGALPAARPGEGATSAPIAQGGGLVKPHQLEEGYAFPDFVVHVPPSETIKKMRQHPEIAEHARDWAAAHLLGENAQVTKAVRESSQALDLQHSEFEAMVSKIADKRDPGNAKHLEEAIAKSAMKKLRPDQIGKLGGPEKAKQQVLARISHTT